MTTGNQPPNLKPPFWLEVEQQVAAGLILLAVAGIGYIGITVPRQLDLVLENQKAILGRQVAAEQRLEKVEASLNGIDRRVTRLEAQ
jgi:hypothetical protein